MIVLSLGTVQARASETSQNEKQVLPVLIVNNSFADTNQSMARIKSDLSIILMNQITKSLGDRYNIKQINNDYNIFDVASTEKNDLLEIFKETSYSTIILAEILPVHLGGMDTATLVTVHFKILSIKDKKYLYNGKFSNYKSHSTKAMETMNIQLGNFM